MSGLLYPTNPDLAGMKKEFSFFFSLFEETSPLSKKLFMGTLEGSRGENNETDFRSLPSFSLGLTQMTPKNLCKELEGEDIRGATTGGMYSHTIKEGFDVVCVREDTNLAQRQRCELRATEICRSPFVSRVVDVVSHTLTTEEKKCLELVVRQ